MNTETRAQLRALAEKATKGPWQQGKFAGDFDMVRQATWEPCGIEGHDDCSIGQSIHLESEPIFLPNVSHPGRARDNARFIAAANPVVILALLDELDAIEAKSRTAERERCAQIASKYRNSYGGEHADYWDGQTKAAEAIADEIRGLS